MKKKVNITKRLRKISHNRIDDPAPNILFKYCKGANHSHYGLGKELGVYLITVENEKKRENNKSVFLKFRQALTEKLNIAAIGTEIE